MGIIDQTRSERDRQITILLRSIARAQKLIEPMEVIGEREERTIQEFIAYSIPRCNLLFQERQQFRNILKALSYHRTDKRQAEENLLNLKYALVKSSTILEGVQ